MYSTAEFAKLPRLLEDGDEGVIEAAALPDRLAVITEKPT
jgi:hypothetical protein